jgi:hypothetical protein
MRPCWLSVVPPAGPGGLPRPCSTGTGSYQSPETPPEARRRACGRHVREPDGRDGGVRPVPGARRAGPVAAAPARNRAEPRTLTEEPGPPGRRFVANAVSAPSHPVAFHATGLSAADVAFAPNRLTCIFDRPNDRSLGRLRLALAERRRSVKADSRRSARSERLLRLFAPRGETGTPAAWKPRAFPAKVRFRPLRARAALARRRVRPR